MNPLNLLPGDRVTITTEGGRIFPATYVGVDRVLGGFKFRLNDGKGFVTITRGELNANPPWFVLTKL